MYETREAIRVHQCTVQSRGDRVMKTASQKGVSHYQRGITDNLAKQKVLWHRDVVGPDGHLRISTDTGL